MRLRGASADLEQAGESTDGMCESTAKLQAKIKALSGVDIMADKDTFKSSYQIMSELSSHWGEMSDVNQASLLETIAGSLFEPEYVEIHIWIIFNCWNTLRALHYNNRVIRL